MNKPRTLYIALTLTCLVFAFFWLPVPRLFDIACILLILLFLPTVLSPANSDLRKDPLIRLGIVFFLYLVCSIIWHRMTLPDYFPNTTSDRRFLRVLYFIAIAYTISRSRLLNAWRLLAIAFGGLLAYLTISFDQAEWIRAWDGQRVDFGIHNAQHTGVVFATCALAFGLFTPRFLAWIKGTPRALACASSLLWIAALLFSLWGVFVSQTRAVWLGLSVALLLFPGILILAYSLREKPRLSLRKSVFTSIAGILLLGLLAIGLDAPNLVSERLSAEKVTWESLRSAASHEDRKLSSIEVRVASWAAATDWIMERPFMGWGGRGSRPLIRQSDLFSHDFKKKFNHLHNSYLQVLVEVGLIGAAFIVVLTALLGRACVRSYQRHAMPLDVFLFAWAFFIFWLVVNLFESYIIYPSGTYLVAIVTAFFYSFCINHPERLS
ncbi:O-antigen ligase family protein [Pseudomonas stutzeri]|uniref:O-antigen ligase family protein n=1 Tax=Stutzerimonas stutzeri TaxID=316 RepID=UPI00210EE0EE|nr:O-antigen ligase family protein [Stutzerimonas stutzeri]MCQ4311292.1 O-antigen ligase family protein [Stutzerimonas stutzeri]